MSAVAPPARSADAETVTAEALVTLRPAEYEMISYLVKVDTTHSEPWIGSENDRARSLFQAPIRLGRVHSQRGSA